MRFWIQLKRHNHVLGIIFVAISLTMLLLKQSIAISPFLQELLHNTIFILLVCYIIFMVTKIKCGYCFALVLMSALIASSIHFFSWGSLWDYVMYLPYLCKK
jgi:hypothetical protein